MIKKIFTVIFFLNSFILPQNFSNGFNFNLPWNDTTTQKFLPQFPVKEIKDFISINSDGNFASGEERIRFWGGNMAADGAFPDYNKAAMIAGRIRKMGFNLMRLHHLDNPWSSKSLFSDAVNTRSLNPFNLDLLENNIAELKKNSVYINMNLNVSRPFKVTDGVQYADSIPDYAKGVTIFDPYLIQLEKEYAEQLLTHINPYTNLPLVDDPVMAMVEIVNENSLYRMWRDGNLKTFGDGGKLIWRHNHMLDSLWNKFLSDKYTSTQNLAAAWNTGASSGNFVNQIVDGNFETGTTISSWIVELHESASASQTKDISNPYEGLKSAKITVTKTTGTSWHIQWKQVNIKLKKDSLYTVEFAARADADKSISVSMMQDDSPYTNYGGKDFDITTDWKIYSFSFKASETINTGRLSFSFNNNIGAYWFDNIKLGITGKTGLIAGESIESRNIKRIDYTECVTYTDARIADISSFYIKLQDDFYAEMKDYLKNTLKVKVPIVGTNWNVGPGDLVSQSKLDYLDNHTYWDHPQFPNEPWSSTDWLISNEPMVKSSSMGATSVFAGVASVGKPFTVSEINYCFPNRYQTEGLIFTTAYSSFHNTDAIMYFDYNGGSEWIADRVDSYFSIHRNNAVMALIPSCAYAYRNGFISPAKETIKLNFSNEMINLLPKYETGDWDGPSFFNKKLSLIHSFRNESFDSAAPTDFSAYQQEPASPYVSDTDEIVWNTNGLITVTTEKFIGVSGFLNNFINSKAGNLQIKSADDSATITWVSLTGDSILVSDKSLITISTVTQNTGMVWEGTSTFHNNWGRTPTQLKPTVIMLNLNVAADSLKVIPLDNTGKEKGTFRMHHPVIPNNFLVEFDLSNEKTLWFGVEAYGNGNPSSVESEDNKNYKFSLEQNYPNPFNPTTTIKFSVPVGAYCNTPLQNVLLKVYDVLGREVATLVNEAKPAGNYHVNFNAGFACGGLTSGIYFYILRAGSYIESKKMILIK